MMIHRLYVVGCALLFTVAMVSPTQASEPEVLPLPGFGDLVVDNAERRVFISGGTSSNGVVVVDRHGHVNKKIENQYGATGLLLSEDGTTLYVAQAAGDAISAISTHTYEEIARYPTGSQTCPTHLARAGGQIWFGYGCTNSWDGGIGKLDPAATPPVSLAQHGDTLFQHAPFVTAANNTVVAGQPATSLSHLQIYRAENGALTPGAAGGVAGSNLTDVALSPDAATLFTAAGSRTAVQAFATADLSGRGSYATGPHPAAIVASEDGIHLATGAYTTRNKAINIFRTGQTNPTRSFGLDGDVLANRGLAWSDDNKYLYAVLQGANDPRPRLTVLSRPLD
ncbi:SMP-30/gluconolactonase/LRE family protein [Lentzea tibetensis]|uniref:SMP-30/gluconolactonase/LRE family protein n=1 Tax=Lentzea tibetensis TaxID=2591470 RepID=A0A563F354_9PSEU|nr:SMP-30/gluconolactonase/LRE family protein [Lentzea tibetensis]TWP54353.1 SMP-30/gluconolactonase/LRE family protein [Lentzea tibetensis]